MTHSPTRWAVKCESYNNLDGHREHFEYVNFMPALFHTREEARAYVQKRHGYLAKRPDLRREPHGWKMPKPVRVQLIEVVRR